MSQHFLLHSPYYTISVKSLRPDHFRNIVSGNTGTLKYYFYFQVTVVFRQRYATNVLFF